MIIVNLSDINQIVEISKVCEKYRSDVAVDAYCGRYIVDAASVLGMQSMIGNKVELKPLGSDRDKVAKLVDELLQINGVKTEC